MLSATEKKSKKEDKGYECGGGYNPRHKDEKTLKPSQKISYGNKQDTQHNTNGLISLYQNLKCVHYTRDHKQTKNISWEKITASTHFLTNDQYW